MKRRLYSISSRLDEVERALAGRERDNRDDIEHVEQISMVLLALSFHGCLMLTRDEALGKIVEAGLSASDAERLLEQGYAASRDELMEKREEILCVSR
jgi:hypothetical protein